VTLQEGKGVHLQATVMVRCSLLVAVLMSAGCSSYWGRRRVDQPTPVKAHQPVWIWSGGQVKKWHAVVITQDSVSGIPYSVPLKCYGCRRSMPRTQVDSMKLGYHTVPEYVIQGTGIFAALTLAEAAVCAVLLPRDPQC